MADDEAMQQLHALMTQAIAARDSKVATVSKPSMMVTLSEASEPLVLKINPHANGSALNGEAVIGAD